jgi:two-component system response regulator AtoC
MAYDWPGNVRELENCLERAVALGDQRVLEVDDLPPSIAHSEIEIQAQASSEPSSRITDARGTDVRGTDLRTNDLRTNDLEDIERATIERVFSQVKGDKTLAGRMLGISRATLYRKLKRYNIGTHEDSSQSTTLQ